MMHSRAPLDQREHSYLALAEIQPQLTSMLLAEMHVTPPRSKAMQ